MVRAWVPDARRWEGTSCLGRDPRLPDPAWQAPGPRQCSRAGTPHELLGGQDGTASGDRVSRLGGPLRRAFRLGGPRPRPGRRCPHPQRRVPGDHALSGGAVGAVRIVVLGGLALLRPRLALPAPGLTKAPARRNGRSVLTSSLIRQDLVPMLTGYLLAMAALRIRPPPPYRPRATPGQAPGRAGEQPGRPRAPTESRRGWPALIRRVTRTAVAGYLFLMAVVIGYYYCVSRRVGPVLG